MIDRAERPLILVGGGAIRAGASDALKALVEKLQVPVATTLPAKGYISEDHPLSLGTLGRSGWASAAEAAREADVVVGVGARFSDNHTANWRKGSIYDVANTKIVQVDIDGTEIGRNFPVAIGVVSDAKLFLEDLTAVSKPSTGKHGAWIKRARGYREAWLKEIKPLQEATTAPVHPARLVYEVGQALPENGIVYIDIGDVTQYAEAYMFVRTPGAWQISPGMAEMGWAASGVLGGVAADPSRPAIVLTGDGAFNLVSQGVATAVEYNLPAIWVILNNYEFGIERKGMERAYDRVHPWCRFTRKDTGERYNPDYVKLAAAYGAEGARIEDPSVLGPTLKRAIASRRPWIIDVPIDLSVGSYFAKGIDRAYPDKWSQSYPGYGLLRQS
jgi:acetolactate synthase-1/2/3 large subunit